MRRFFSIAPWLMDLFNPPPRDSLSVLQKVGRVLLVTVTLVTLCVISALVLALGFFVLQRSHEVLAGVPQLMNVLTILVASAAVNVICVMALFEIRRLDRRLIPEDSKSIELEIPLPPRTTAAEGSKA